MTPKPSPVWLLAPLAFLLLVAGCPSAPKGSSTAAPSKDPACTDTCESLGHACGEVCGQACGPCSPDAQGHATSCLAGQCRCLPACSGTSCGQDDGCGGQCPCPEDVSCGSCALRLVRLDQRNSGGGVERVTVALEGTNLGTDVAPRLADFKVRTDPPLRLERLEIGPALADSKKLLHRFVGTNLPFQEETSGSWRVVVQTGARHTDIPPGRWLTLHFVAQGAPPPPGPVSVRLVRQADLLAPREAELALQSTQYDAPLVVLPVR